MAMLRRRDHGFLDRFAPVALTPRPAGTVLGSIARIFKHTDDIMPEEMQAVAEQRVEPGDERIHRRSLAFQSGKTKGYPNLES